MSKSRWIFTVIIPFLLTWFVDWATKQYALETITTMKFYGPLGLLLHFNKGAMLGLFSDLPAVLRIVTLSTGGAFLIFIFFSIHFLLPSKSVPLRVGLSMLLGGIIGNVTDRIVWGYIVDFIVFRHGTTLSPVFNIADALQWVGYGLIVIGLMKDGKNIWPKDNLRKSFVINLHYQMKYCFTLMIFGLCFALIAGVYSYTYMRVTIIELSGEPALDTFIYPFMVTFAIVSLTFMIILFAVGMMLSHRAAGPIYAFEKFLEDLSKGKVRKLKLRDGDDFTHLEEVADELSNKMKVILKKVSMREVNRKP